MATIKTKQGNELQLFTRGESVYVKTAKGDFAIESLDYITGRVKLAGVNGGFILNSRIDLAILSGAIDRASEYKHLQFPDLPLLDESALDDSLAALEGICRDL